jgi:hypothetical protein
MKIVKIIFLDVDGVLRRVQDRHLNPILIENINILIEKTGAKVVISSSWKENGLDYVKEKLNLRGDVIDITPSFTMSGKSSYNIDVPRGIEIREWIEEYTTMEQYVGNYVIIDDSIDILYSQKDVFVRCDQTKGFNTECLNKAIDILNSSKMRS